MTTLEFTVTFHTPYIPASGQGFQGRDVSVADIVDDTERIKGAARDVARRQLGLADEYVERVFGSPARPAPWHWHLRLDQPVVRSTHDRIRIDPDTRAAADGAKLLTDVVHLPKATLTVRQTGADVTDDDVLMLRAALRGVKHLGTARRRGFGLVTISDGDDFTTEHVARLRRMN